MRDGGVRVETHVRRKRRMVNRIEKETSPTFVFDRTMSLVSPPPPPTHQPSSNIGSARIFKQSMGARKRNLVGTGLSYGPGGIGSLESSLGLLKILKV